jgi:hypothetical protein
MAELVMHHSELTQLIRPLYICLHCPEPTLYFSLTCFNTHLRTRHKELHSTYLDNTKLLHKLFLPSHLPDDAWRIVQFLAHLENITPPPTCLTLFSKLSILNQEQYHDKHIIRNQTSITSTSTTNKHTHTKL